MSEHHTPQELTRAQQLALGQASRLVAAAEGVPLSDGLKRCTPAALRTLAGQLSDLADALEPAAVVHVETREDVVLPGTVVDEEGRKKPKAKA
jgi:hypothetical protein